MHVSVEKTSELSRKMTVSIPDEVVQEKMETRLKKLAREVKVDGFRPGKVPVQVVKKLYSARIKSEVAEELIESSYYKALEEQSLTPAGYPHIQSVKDEVGFEYVAEFEVYPEISIDGISQLTVTRPVASVAANDVDAMIDKLRQQKKIWQAAERASASGDQVTIHFSGVCDGENFTDGTVENYKLELGANQMIPGFEDALIGLSVGETKSFVATFPEQYNSPKLAGKEATFDIEMVAIDAPQLPELDAAFIQTYGVESGDANDFRQDVQSNMERELVKGLKNRLKTAVLDVLYENVPITVPTTLVDQEIKNSMQPYAERAKKMGLKIEDLNLPADMFESQAKRRVALGLLLGEIIQKNSLTVDADKVRAVIDDMAKSYEKPEEVVNWYYADKTRLNDVQQMVLEDQAVEWVLSQTTVTDQTISFADVMESN